ncbi:AbrB family transcriptional regulator [Prochlorothrix hollandica]|uniref:AbrB family transcriptional regulator n=1 Tax=Prochlorothrix hollandica TaxID=1223 RepID=UPI00333E342C
MPKVKERKKAAPIPVLPLLTGKALLNKTKELPDLSRRDLARECGYFSATKKGEIRINLAEFYEALLQARGISLDSESGQKRGREATYRVSVQKNGQILIGSAYTKEMGLEPGDVFEVKLGYKHIHLIHQGLEDEE